MQPTHRSSRILLPVRHWFIVVSLALALFLELLPLGRVHGMPEWLALAIAFWSVREPHKVGMSVAFLLGIVMDVAGGAIMGQHALAYVMVAYGGAFLSRRILWFGLWLQALHVFPMMLGMQLIVLLVRMAVGGEFPGWTWLLSSLTTTLLWPPFTYLLLLPQYQPMEKDENRPI